MNQIPLDVYTALEKASLTEYWNGMVSGALIAMSAAYLADPTPENEQLLNNLIRRAKNDGRGMSLN